MKRITLINASQWQHIQCGTKHIYSPNPAILDSLQKKQTIESFWLHIYTAFVCIIYDDALQKIIAVRDHFGLEPCYYSHINGRFIFGSTIPSILKYNTAQIGMNSTQVNQLFIRNGLMRKSIVMKRIISLFIGLNLAASFTWI